MDLLTRINKCLDEDLNFIIDEALQETIKKCEKNKSLGFPNGGILTTKILVHKGFISPDSRIKYSNLSMNSYSMETTDYFYEFAKFIKVNHVNSRGYLVKMIENFINIYFGTVNGCDIRDAYFDAIAYQTTTTDDEYFEKLDKLQLGDLKGRNIAMCTERAAMAQNLLSLFGFEVYYCIGVIDNNGKSELHSFNIAKAKNSFILLDYSIPIPVIKDSDVVDYAPFQGTIENSEFTDFVTNGISATFDSYKYKKVADGIIKETIDEKRTYVVGCLQLEEKITQKK